MKKSILIIIILCVIYNTKNYAQQFRFAQNDRWYSTSGAFLKYDKLEHCIGSVGLVIIGMNWKYAMLSGFLWEIKDGFMPYEKYGWWGGEGFSFKDLTADFIGIGCGIAFNHLIKPQLFKGLKYIWRKLK